MKRNILAKSIKQIISNQLNLNKNYFNQFSNEGENLLLDDDLKIDLLDKYEILNKIESKHNILIANENILSNNLTIGQYIDEIYKEFLKS